MALANHAKSGMNNHSVRTKDGRLLQVVEGGDEKGKPVFFLNGTPGCRFLYQPHVRDAASRGIRLIGYDRPGYGKSTPDPGRRVVDATDDVIAIADKLKLDRFAVWGISGGGPHALACAARLKGRVAAVASLASPAPYPSPGLEWFDGMGEENIAEFKAALDGKARLEQYLLPVCKQMRNAKPEDLATAFQTLLSPTDRGVLTGDLLTYLHHDILEAIRGGLTGWRDDDLAFMRPWGFDLSDIDVHVLMMHGRRDRFVSFAHGHWLAEHIPHVETRLSDKEGHLSLFERRVPETHDWLLRHF